MSEESIINAEPTAVADSTGAEASTESFVGADGSFSPNWYENLSEDIKDAPALQNFKDINGLAKSLVNAQKLIGADKIQLPSDKSTEEEWDEFYNKIGRPESPDKYQFNLPEGVEVNEGMLKGFGETAHKLGLNNKQAAELLTWYNSSVGDINQQQAMQEAKTYEEAEKALKTEWGHKYDENISFAQRTAKTFALGEMLAERNLDNDPAMIKALADIGKSLSEDTIVGSTTNPFPNNPNVEINRIMGDKNHPYHQKDHPQHDDAVKQMNQLFNQIV